MTLSSSTLYDWPDDRRVYLTVDFECDFGTALKENRYQSVQEVGTLVSLIEQFDVPLTCFVQTEVLDHHPEMVERLREAAVPVTFHPHSHTHRPRDETSISEEIERSTERYRDYFGERPVGYRFPNGNVQPSDYELLAEHGYAFDASVFPSWRPGHFDNTGEPSRPTYHADYDLFELPFTVYSNRLRIPTALSYCQVIGWPYTSLLSYSSPSVLVLNIHMHDLVKPPSRSDLPLPYRLLYSRNARGDRTLTDLLSVFSERGYTFDTLDSAHSKLRDRAGSLNPSVGPSD
ncbi:polysaccharide deacetylase family protein [Halorientalis regularis]|uniref:Polysaccharide deacetylase n=1 Tax=Halorientalis regularis TaxID=660518 RepID=A0A1G7T210_9EURY|nr:Polysaccharide deacetylase [Halorientalis regularis]